MRALTVAAIPVVLLACVTTPQYPVVTPLPDGNLALSRESIDPFESGEDAEREAKAYCAGRNQPYKLVNRQTRYVNKGSDAVHRVTLLFVCES